MAATFQDGHEQIDLLYKAGPNWPNSSLLCQNYCFEYSELSSECSRIPLCSYNASDITC